MIFDIGSYNGNAQQTFMFWDDWIQNNIEFHEYCLCTIVSKRTKLDGKYNRKSAKNDK